MMEHHEDDYLCIAVIAASLSIHIDLLNWCLLRLEILMKYFSGGLYLLWWNQRNILSFVESNKEGKNEKRGWKANQWRLNS